MNFLIGLAWWLYVFVGLGFAIWHVSRQVEREERRKAKRDIKP